jgi:hypothetical protein
MQNLFVTKLPRNITDADLMQVFIDYKPQSAKVMLDAASGKSKGFGFVLFDTAEQGAVAYEAMNHRHVAVHNHSFTLHIFPSKHDGRTAAVESNALYIRNIPISVTYPEVHSLLSRFGTVTCCSLRPDNHGQAVWVVFAVFDTVRSASDALRVLHGSTTHFQSTVPILAKFQDSEEAKQERRKRRSHDESSAGRSDESPHTSAGASLTTPPHHSQAHRPGNFNGPLPPPRWQEVVRDGKYVADDTPPVANRVAGKTPALLHPSGTMMPPFPPSPYMVGGVARSPMVHPSASLFSGIPLFRGDPMNSLGAMTIWNPALFHGFAPF